MARTPRRLPAAPHPPATHPPAPDEPRRRVGAGWVAAFAVAWLGIWMAQLTPVQLLLPLQVANARPGADWVGSVVGFGVVSGIAGACALVAYPLAGAACDRTRLTADGQVRTCLFAREETDLRGALRSGASDEEIAGIWRAAMWGKKAGAGLDDPSFVQPDRPMSAIGG